MIRYRKAFYCLQDLRDHKLLMKNSRKVVNQKVRTMYFLVSHEGISKQHSCWCCLQACALVQKIPSCHSQVPSNPCAAVSEGTDGQVFVCWSFPAGLVTTCPLLSAREPRQRPSDCITSSYRRAPGVSATMLSFFTQ